MAQVLRVYTHRFIFLFSLLFSIKAINSHNHHYHNGNGVLDRNKRDVFAPNILRIQIIHGKDTETFELSKITPDYLVNWNAFVYAYNKNAANNFNNFGQISSFKDLTTFYYDEPTHSAVVFYNQTIVGGNCLVNGIVGEKYVLKYKPYAEYKGVANISVDSTDVIPKKIKRRTRSISEALKTNIGNSYENPEFYMETLVFIDGTLINEQFPGEMKRESNRQKLYVMQVLSFLNVINMLFSKTNFRINIAGIVFNERYEDGRFSFLNSAFSEDAHQYEIPQVVDAFYEGLPKLPHDLPNRDLVE
uniref:BVpp48b protein n=1 Tax=Chelonus inanitus TaxID=49201 RepID=D7FB37_9HYME|nr:BVpp48b protein [Chelonus inanitus]